jgi:hypothetical protein
VQKNGVVIRRKLPHPGEFIPPLKSQLVLLYENEPAEPIPATICLQVNSKIKNSRLEKLMLKRSNKKFNELSSIHKNDEQFSEFSSRADLIQNLNSLMNYDFCNNKHNKNKVKSNPKPRKIKQPKASPSKTNEADTAEFFSLLETVAVETKMENMNDSDDVLYSDLIDNQNNEPIINTAKDEIRDELVLSEEGELADDLTLKDYLNNKTNVVNENRSDDEQSNKKRKLSTSTALPLPKQKDDKNSKENNWNYNKKSNEIDRSRDYKPASSRDRPPSRNNYSSDRYRSSKTRSRSKSRGKTRERFNHCDSPTFT